MQTDFKAGIGTPDEQRFAGRVAGVLFIVGGLTASALPLIPGVTRSHWTVLAVLTVLAVAWGVTCLTVIDFSRATRAVFLLPGVFSLCLITIAIASSGGSDSPERYLVMFLVVYAASFYRPGDAIVLTVLSVLANASPLLYDGGGVDGVYQGELVVLSFAYLALGATIIEGKKLLVAARSRAQELALRDPLTGLANRRAMMQWLEGRLAGRDMSLLGLVLVDLDGFKDVNTVHGYQAGDRVLCEAARVLHECVRGDDLVARLGGDEFAVLVPGSDPQDVGRIGQKVIGSMRSLNHHMDLAGVTITASVGWVVYPRDAGSIEELVRVADSCLRGAKATGKDRALSPTERGSPLAV